MEQAIGAVDDGLVAGILQKCRHETQTNVTALVEILDENSEVIFDITETIDTIFSFGQSPCPPAGTGGLHFHRLGARRAQITSPGDLSLKTRWTRLHQSTILEKEFVFSGTSTVMTMSLRSRLNSGL